MGEEADGREGIDLILHSFDGVIEPPTGSKLNFPAHRRFLEGTTGRCKDGIISWIKVVDDGLGQAINRCEGIEEGENRLSLRPIADGVES